MLALYLLLAAGAGIAAALIIMSPYLLYLLYRRRRHEPLPTLWPWGGVVALFAALTFAFVFVATFVWIASGFDQFD